MSATKTTPTITVDDVIEMLEREAREAMQLAKTQSARMRRKNEKASHVQALVAGLHFSAASYFGLADNLRTGSVIIRPYRLDATTTKGKRQ